MDCDTIGEMLEAYALDALDAEERAMVERHLDECPQCRDLLGEYAAIVAGLPGALATVSQRRLPDSVKVELLRKIGGVSAPPTADQAEEKAALSPAVPPMAGAQTSRRVQRLRLALVLAAALLAISLAWSIRLNVALARERALRAEFAELVDQQELVLEVVDSSRTTRRVLLPPDGDSPAYGKLFTRSDMPYVVAMAARLSPPPSGEAYHLWLIQGDRVELAGMLAVNEEGFGLLIYQADRTDPEYAAARVTLQPIGSAAPVAPPVLVWQASE